MLIFAVQVIYFFGVEEKKIERVVQTIAALWSKFCRLIEQVLPPYRASFATFRWKFCRVLPSYVKFLKHSTKVCCIFLGGRGGGCKSLSMDSLLLSKIKRICCYLRSKRGYKNNFLMNSRITQQYHWTVKSTKKEIWNQKFVRVRTPQLSRFNYKYGP
jgi:hypothetical protein